jgi:Na+/citrate or Na+/malate symporter
MSSEELAAAGVPPTEGNAPSSTNDPAAKTIRDSSSCEDGEIRSENRFGGDEDLSNVQVDLSELVTAKVKSYRPAFVFGMSKVTAETIKEYEKAGFSLLVMIVHLLKKKLLLPKKMKLSSSGISSFVVSDFHVILYFLLFLIDSP